MDAADTINSTQITNGIENAIDNGNQSMSRMNDTNDDAGVTPRSSGNCNANTANTIAIAV